MKFGTTTAARFVARRMPLLLATLIAATPSATWGEPGQFSKVPSFHLPEGEIWEGDRYAMTNNATIAGTNHGDLFIFGQSTVISGEIDGDLFSWSQTLTINGTVRDSVRAGAQTINVNGLIDGDLLAFGAVVDIGREAHVTGNVRVFSGQLMLNGTVDGGLHGTGGELDLDGTVGGDVEVEFDTIELGPRASIAGDLSYTSRKELDVAGRGIVGGEIDFKEKKKKGKSRRPWLSASGVLWWLWHAGLALVLGALLIRLLPRPLRAASEVVGRETLLGGLIGFGSSIVAPVAAILAVVLVVAIPLFVISLATGRDGFAAFVTTTSIGAILITLVLAALYVAKIPVAVWLGSWLLGRTGRADPSPYLALMLGVPLLYLLFEVPYGGFLFWLLATWLGLGAAILALYRYLQGQASGGATAVAVDMEPSTPEP